jgi:hypothetical protein
MKKRSGNKKGSSGESMPRRSKRLPPPSTPDLQAGTAAARSTDGKKLEVAKKTRTTKIVTPESKSGTPLAELRSRLGGDTIVRSHDVDSTKEVEVSRAKIGVDDVKNGDNVSMNKKIKMFAGYKSTNDFKDTGDETIVTDITQLSVRDRKALLRAFHEDDDSIPDSVFPDWVP